MLGSFETIAAAILGILGLIGALFLRRSGRKDAERRIEKKASDARLENIKKNKETRDEIRRLDDDALFDKSREWLRPSDKRGD